MGQLQGGDVLDQEEPRRIRRERVERVVAGQLDPLTDPETLRVQDEERAVLLERILPVPGARVDEHERRAVARDTAGRPAERDGGDSEAAAVGPPAHDAAVASPNGRHRRRSLASDRDVADLPAGCRGAEPAEHDAGIRSGCESRRSGAEACDDAGEQAAEHRILLR